MINAKRLLKAGAAWASIAYIICFFGVLLFPGLRFDFPRYGLHMIVPMGINVMTVGTFISGLVFWNIIAFVGLWLFAVLFNSMKE